MTTTEEGTVGKDAPLVQGVVHHLLEIHHYTFIHQPGDVHQHCVAPHPLVIRLPGNVYHLGVIHPLTWWHHLHMYMGGVKCKSSAGALIF